jgi:hypothetical protein
MPRRRWRVCSQSNSCTKVILALADVNLEMAMCQGYSAFITLTPGPVPLTITHSMTNIKLMRIIV